MLERNDTTKSSVKISQHSLLGILSNVLQAWPMSSLGRAGADPGAAVELPGSIPWRCACCDCSKVS